MSPFFAVFGVVFFGGAAVLPPRWFRFVYFPNVVFLIAKMDARRINRGPRKAYCESKGAFNISPLCAYTPAEALPTSSTPAPIAPDEHTAGSATQQPTTITASGDSSVDSSVSSSGGNGEADTRIRQAHLIRYGRSDGAALSSDPMCRGAGHVAKFAQSRCYGPEWRKVSATSGIRNDQHVQNASGILLTT